MVACVLEEVAIKKHVDFDRHLVYGHVDYGLLPWTQRHHCDGLTAHSSRLNNLGAKWDPDNIVHFGKTKNSHLYSDLVRKKNSRAILFKDR